MSMNMKLQKSLEQENNNNFVNKRFLIKRFPNFAVALKIGFYSVAVSIATLFLYWKFTSLRQGSNLRCWVKKNGLLR